MNREKIGLISGKIIIEAVWYAAKSIQIEIVLAAYQNRYAAKTMISILKIIMKKK